MARIARVVVPDFPHHIVQRGNRRQQVFFDENDYKNYLDLLYVHSRESKLDILTYCLMPNHVHLVVIPKNIESLSKAIGETHRKYTRHINFREKWRGYLWQGRFSSHALDEKYLLAATRYILNNPVKANIVKDPWDYGWSSVRHHLNIEKSLLINDALFKGLITDWRGFLKSGSKEEDIKAITLHERTGRPLGNTNFIEMLENSIGKSLKKKKPGPKRKGEHN